MITAQTYQGKTLAVFGLARTGLAAVRGLEKSGAKVWAWDDNAGRRAAVGSSLQDLYSADFQKLDALLLAPGVPLTHPQPHAMVMKAKDAGVTIISDFDIFQAARCDMPPHQLVAVTGTNGKSTTTALIAYMAEKCGRPSAAAGNIGDSLLGLDPLPENGIYVVEASSFQLDLTKNFQADVAVLLNITPDHLDRHGTMDGYSRAKKRLFDMQEATGKVVICVDDDHCRDIASRARGEVIPVSVEHPLTYGVYMLDGVLFDALSEVPIAVGSMADYPTLIGKHNGQNVAAAYAAGISLGLKRTEIIACFKDFPGLAHRQEHVGDINGIKFVNDSKATNSDAAIRALRSYENIHWIAGGQPKERMFERLSLELIHVKHAYLIGAAADTLGNTLKSHIPSRLCRTLDVAVRQAYKNADQGDVILLSPACSSFDQFPNFEARGDAFKAIFQSLEERGKAKS